MTGYTGFSPARAFPSPTITAPVNALNHCLSLALVFTLAAAAPKSGRVNASEVSFIQNVRPILSEHCFACHGPDAETREGGLRLDQAEAALESGAIVAGDVQASEIWAPITSSDPEMVMPPPEFQKPVLEAERDILPALTQLTLTKLLLSRRRPQVPK